MLHVKTPDEALELIQAHFSPLDGRTETADAVQAVGRVLARDIRAVEYVPDFNRSTVDGYALRAQDTFGCSEAIPAILPLDGEVQMGRGGGSPLPPGSCRGVPTGGAIPEGADCAVMVEYTEDYGDGTIGVCKSAAPGQNMIFRGDDVRPGQTVLRRGHILGAQDIGALSAMGLTQVPVVRRLRVGVISTGDELVPPAAAPGPGQVRDVNAPMLLALLAAAGAEGRGYPIVPDDGAMLEEAVRRAAGECDAVLISGGTSVGARDHACRVIGELGEVLFHGIAIKPGKPTILGKTEAGGKPLVGLPGHPVAAYFVTKLFVLPLLNRLMGADTAMYPVTARLTESVGANHGRAQVNGVRLERRGGVLWARPVRSKSGLITTLAGTDGYFCIQRDCEGLPKGAEIQVTICMGE